MPPRPETLPARIGAALAAAAETAALGSLYYECYGQPCHQRGRILHFLALYLKQHPIPTPASAVKAGKGRKPLIIKKMPYQFKDAFMDVSIIIHGVDGTKEVHAGNLTDEDAEIIIADGKGHLLQPATAEQAAAAVKVAAPILSTRTDGGQVSADVSDVDVHEIAEATARANQAANEADIESAEADAEQPTPTPAK